MTLSELKIIQMALDFNPNDNSKTLIEARRLIQLEIDRKIINPTTNRPYDTSIRRD